MKETVCPNCINPYKCNGPHVFTLSDKVYKCEYGYLIKRRMGFCANRN
jgi:hypothetical protein